MKLQRNWIFDTALLHSPCFALTHDERSHLIQRQVYGNTLVNCEYCGIKIQEEDQGVICENVIEPPNGVSNVR